jgi:hypothetical protein
MTNVAAERIILAQKLARSIMNIKRGPQAVHRVGPEVAPLRQAVTVEPRGFELLTS